MTTRWRSGFAAIAVSVATVALVVVDVADDDLRAWWAGHALTTSTVSGLLVLLITVLVVDQVTHLREARGRARAVAAQAAIVLGQAQRACRSVSAVLDGSGSRDDAGGDIRNYLVMLLVSAPLLIDTAPTRAFLEEAQRLGADLTHLLDDATAPADAAVADHLAAATDRIRAVSAPLLRVLHPAERTAATGADG